MAPRKVSLNHHAEVRKRIQTPQLLNRLQKNALDDVKFTTHPDGTIKSSELTMGQIRSIEILLRKTLPDLSSVIVTGDSDNPIIHRIERVIVEPSE
jgi:hypothetical protein